MMYGSGNKRDRDFWSSFARQILNTYKASSAKNTLQYKYKLHLLDTCLMKL